MPKPTFASVTDVACTCGYLELQAESPDVPIEYDRETNEYQFTWPTKEAERAPPSMAVIYHCPFCGGAAPASKRDTLFAVVSQDEIRRLNELFQDVQTLNEVIAKFGPPDFDSPEGLTASEPAKEEEPPVTRPYRAITYSKLSDSADVMVVDYRNARVGVSFLGKYLKPA